jgi:rod shape-determining protein MreB
MAFDFLNARAGDLAIDLGTANTLVYAKGKGIVVNEPSVVAIAMKAGRPQVLAVGEEARQMLGKTPESIRAIRPMRKGVIGDFEAAQAMISYFIRQAARRRGFRRPRVVISTPQGATPVERRAIREAAEGAGAGHVFLIEEPMAAAIGADLPVTSPRGSMVVDLGGGTTEVAVISLGGIVNAVSIPVGGDDFDEGIHAYVRRVHNVAIGESTAERIKREVGAALIPEEGEGEVVQVSGRDLVSGVPKAISVSEAEIAESLTEAVFAIVEGVKSALERTAPELAADIVDTGLVLTGGGALLRRLPDAVRHATGLPVSVAEDPLTCGVRGAGKALSELKTLQSILND